MSKQPKSVEPTRLHRTRRWAGRIAFGLVLAMFALIGIAVLSGRYQVRPVLSGSMRPGLAVGGVVITERVPLDDIKVRDVIVFTRPDEPSEKVVHRVIALTRSHGIVTIRTQGDANEAEDPWTLHLAGSTAYRAVYAVPLVGYPAVWLHSAAGRDLILVVIGLVIATTALSMWRKERVKDADELTAEIGDDADANSEAEIVNTDAGK